MNQRLEKFFPGVETECVTHRPDYFGPQFQVTRCVHLGERFVVELKRILYGEGVHADYVELLAGGGVACETERGRTAFAWLEAQMIMGVAPNPDNN